jgi:shikimate kinase
MLPRLTLVGYRACGKTTVGRLLAKRLDWPFIDADSALEQRLGCGIATVFATRGEAAFRDEETRMLAEILGKPGGFILATGGGCILRAENRGIIREKGGTVVYLAASAALLQKRLRHDDGKRPSLTGAPVADEVERLLALREPFYREVAHHVIAADRSAESLSAHLAGIVENSSTTE